MFASDGSKYVARRLRSGTRRRQDAPRRLRTATRSGLAEPVSFRIAIHESLSAFSCKGLRRLASGVRSCQGKDADEERQEDPPGAAGRVAGWVLQARGPD